MAVLAQGRWALPASQLDVRIYRYRPANRVKSQYLNDLETMVPFDIEFPF
jgi:hypothetical protein